MQPTLSSSPLPAMPECLFSSIPLDHPQPAGLDLLGSIAALFEPASSWPHGVQASARSGSDSLLSAGP